VRPDRRCTDLSPNGKISWLGSRTWSSIPPCEPRTRPVIWKISMPRSRGAAGRRTPARRGRLRIRQRLPAGQRLLAHQGAQRRGTLPVRHPRPSDIIRRLPALSLAGRFGGVRPRPLALGQTRTHPGATAPPGQRAAQLCQVGGKRDRTPPTTPARSQRRRHHVVPPPGSRLPPRTHLPQVPHHQRVHPPDSEPDSTARTSSSPPNSAGGSGKSSDTKPPNDAWSSCSTAWPDAYWVCPPYARGCRSQSVCAPFLCLNGGAGSRWVPLQHPAQRARRAVTSQAAEPSRTPSGVSCAANSARRFAAAAARCASSAPSRSQADWPSCHLVP
jgi:hypothetical protein